MTDAAAARKIAENLIALAAKATRGPWFHRQVMQTRPWPHEDDEYDWIGDAEKGQPHSKVILQRQSLYGGAPDYAYIAACVPEAITALAQAYLSLSRPQAGTLSAEITDLAKPYAVGQHSGPYNAIRDIEILARVVIAISSGRPLDQIEYASMSVKATPPATEEDA